MARWNVVALATVLGLSLAMPAAAQWKWRDKGGRTQYSDLPPPVGTADQDILQRPRGSQLPPSAAASSAPAGPSASAVAAAPLLAPKASDPELEARRKKAEQELADKRKEDEAKIAAKRAENCSRAQTQIRTIDSGVRLTRVKENGEREYLDDATRAAEARRARDIVASDCK